MMSRTSLRARYTVWRGTYKIIMPLHSHRHPVKNAELALLCVAPSRSFSGSNTHKASCSGSMHTLSCPHDVLTSCFD